MFRGNETDREDRMKATMIKAAAAAATATKR